MLSNDLKSKINKLWDKFWSRGIANPITAIEQISYLLFMKRLDETDAVEKANAIKTRKKFTSVFEGNEDCRWSSFNKLPLEQMLRKVSRKVFQFIKKINSKNEPFSRHMKDAQFSIKNASLLDEAVKDIDEIYEDIKKQKDEGQQFQDTQGDVYEYLLNEISQAGKNGQFRTPRHIIQFMSELLDPDYNDKICDPACGTAGFLVGAYQHILTKYSTPKELMEDENGFKRFKRHGGNKIKKAEIWEKLNTKTFYGFDMDQTMVRIGLMNLILHGVRVPQIENIDSLSKKFDSLYKDGEYTVVMANPPFTGRIDTKEKSDNLKIQGTQTELLFLSRISKMLKKGGKAAVIIPEGVLFGNNKQQKAIREILLKDNRLEAVVSLPGGAFKPYTGVKTAILVFTKVEENSQIWHTKKVWFYELVNDGYSLDDNRKKLSENPLPIAINAFTNRSTKTPKSRKNYFFVPIKEIQENDLDLSYNRYKTFEYEEKEYESSEKLLKELFELENDIQKDMEELKTLVG